MKNVIVDSRINDTCERALMRRGYRVLRLPRLASLPEAIGSHPDTLLFHHLNRIITTADYCDAAAYIFSDLREDMPHISIDFVAQSHGGKYPNDCILNAAVIGNRIFCRRESIAEGVVRYAESAGMEIVGVKQGYAGCATLVLDESHVITADAGLARAYRECGIDVLEIGCGGIALPPYEYGFIGGAAGVDGECVFFMGDPATHPDGDRITEYIESLGMRAVALCDGMLTDLGGLVFLS